MNDTGRKRLSCTSWYKSMWRPSLRELRLKLESGLPDFVKDEFDVFLECGILTHGSMRLRCVDCTHEKLVAFSCKRRGFCPSCGGPCMAQTTARPIDHVIPNVPYPCGNGCFHCRFRCEFYSRFI